MTSVQMAVIATKIMMRTAMFWKTNAGPGPLEDECSAGQGVRRGSGVRWRGMAPPFNFVAGLGLPFSSTWLSMLHGSIVRGVQRQVKWTWTRWVSEELGGRREARQGGKG